MKTSKFLGLALSVLTLAACSQDDDLFQNDAPQTTDESNQIGKVIEMGATGNQSSIATFVVPAGTKTVDVVYNNGEKTVTVDVESAGIATGAFKTVSLKLFADAPTFVDIFYNVNAKSTTRATSNGTRVAAVKHFAVKPSNGDILKVEAVDGLSNDKIDELTNLLLGSADAIIGEEHDNLVAPEGVDNYSKNFVYRSNGNPVIIHPIYLNSSSRNDLGIYYYDQEGTRHDAIIWESEQKEVEDGKSYGYETPYQLYGVDGIKITLPAGYTYGFYIASKFFHNGEAQNYYSLSQENEGFCSTDNYKNCKGQGCHAITFSYNGNTYLGFEDWEHNDYTDENGLPVVVQYDCNDLIVTAPKEVLEVIDTPKEEDLIVKYTVTYHAGTDDFEGTVPAQMTNVPGDSTFYVAQPSNLTYPGHVFKGWADNETGKVYEPGKEYKMDNKNVDLTAIWDDEIPAPLPGADPTPTKEEKDNGTYYHSSGVAMFETTGNDNDYNDAVLDYDIEGYIPSADSLEAGNWPYLKTTIHLRALSDDQITSVGIDLEGLDKDFFCEADDMYITVGNSLDIKEVLKNTTAKIEGTKPNFAEGSYDIDLSGIEWLMTKEACETKYTNSKGVEMFFNQSADPELNYWYNVERDDENFGGDLLTITVVCYPDMSKMTLDEWKEKMEDIICDIENQKFYVTVNGEKNYNCIKAPILTKHTNETNAFTTAYPEYGTEDDWYNKPASFTNEDGNTDDYLIYWW